MFHSPWVTVVCTCFNHAEFVSKALYSILNQTYDNIQLIVIDNASSDNSVQVIQKILHSHPSVLFIRNSRNLGICRAFNEAVHVAEGKYLVDLSADDILLPERIEKQVKTFESLDDSYAMLYSNIEYIDEKGKVTDNSCLKRKYPCGNIYGNILREYIIPSPSTMYRTTCFLDSGGYNEQLIFEDFDFWVRCSYRYNVQFMPEILTQKRVLPKSFSSEFYSRNSDQMLRSTLATYIWASSRLRNTSEKAHYQTGMEYYFRQSVLLGHFFLAKEYLDYMDKPTGLKNWIILFLLKFNITSSLFTRFK